MEEKEAGDEVEALAVAHTWVVRGEGVEETGTCRETGRTLVAVDPRYFRPTEVDQLLGDSPPKVQESPAGPTPVSGAEK